jgi:predicted methyltransferase
MAVRSGRSIAYTAYAIAKVVTAQAVYVMIYAMDEHEEAVKMTAQRLRRAQAALDTAKEQHIAAVLAALRAGRPPMGVAELSPFTDARLRQIARRAGIPPARKGKRTPVG